MDEKKTIKICVSSIGKNLDSEIDPHFGRCEYFVIVEVSDEKIINIESVENAGVNQDRGAGISAAEQIGKLDVDILITGDVGPKAKDILHQLGIQVCKKLGIVRVAISEYLNNNIAEPDKNISSININTKNSEKKEDNQKIFIPLMDDNGKLSEISLHFGHAPFFGLYDVSLQKLVITKNKLDHSNPDITPVDQIIKQVDPSVVFAQDMGSKAVNLFNEKKILLKTGPYKTAKEVIDNIGKLEDLKKGCGH